MNQLGFVLGEAAETAVADPAEFVASTATLSVWSMSAGTQV